MYSCTCTDNHVRRTRLVHLPVWVHTLAAVTAEPVENGTYYRYLRGTLIVKGCKRSCSENHYILTK